MVVRIKFMSVPLKFKVPYKAVQGEAWTHVKRTVSEDLSTFTKKFLKTGFYRDIFFPRFSLPSTRELRFRALNTKVFTNSSPGLFPHHLLFLRKFLRKRLRFSKLLSERQIFEKRWLLLKVWTGVNEHMHYKGAIVFPLKNILTVCGQGLKWSRKIWNGKLILMARRWRSYTQKNKKYIYIFKQTAIYIFFVLFFCLLLLHRLAVRISLPFYVLQV